MRRVLEDWGTLFFLYWKLNEGVTVSTPEGYSKRHKEIVSTFKPHVMESEKDWVRGRNQAPFPDRLLPTTFFPYDRPTGAQ